MNFNDMVKKQRNINKGIITSELSPYELVRIQDERAMDENDLSRLINESDRYHIVDYHGRTLATAKTLQSCFPQICRCLGWNVDAVVDEKNLIAYDIRYGEYGAGHSYPLSLTPRY